MAHELCQSVRVVILLEPACWVQRMFVIFVFVGIFAINVVKFGDEHSDAAAAAAAAAAISMD